MKKVVRKILDDLENEDKKEKIMFYFSRQTHLRLKSWSSKKKIKMSDLLEKIINAFLDEAEELESKSKRK